MRAKWVITICMLSASLTLWAAGGNLQQQTDSLKADSINVAAAHPDFVKVWLMTVTPGLEGTSTFGHAALRLQCESEQLDYCFSFAMETDDISILKFIRGSSRGGFQTVTTDEFLSRYRKEGRGVSQIQLNLLPGEEQELWRLLDHEVEQGPRWDYNFISTSCTSMCIWAVKACLKDEHIVYHQLDPILSATYAEVLHSMATYVPWLEFLLNVRFFSQRHDVGDVDEKFSPGLLMSSWQKATLVSDKGTGRPMTIGEPQTLFKADPSVVPHRPFLTPVKVLAALVLLLAGIVAYLYVRHQKRKH